MKRLVVNKMEFKQLLKNKGYTQTALAKLSGVSQSNISIYCNYRSALENSSALTRAKLAAALGFNLSFFEQILDLTPSKILSGNTQTMNYNQKIEIKIKTEVNE